MSDVASEWDAVGTEQGKYPFTAGICGEFCSTSLCACDLLHPVGNVILCENTLGFLGEGFRCDTEYGFHAF